jgi:LPXTG-motif cell wall-anchored protein
LGVWLIVVCDLLLCRAIIGGIVGGLACVALVAGGGFYAYKKKKEQGEKYANMVESTTSML